MNKTEYLESLKKELRRLPQEDLNKALEYFEEYFADAGEENEQKAMNDLGTPANAAEQIITNMAIANTKEPVKDIKKGLHAVWVGILAVFATPIAVPLMLVLAMVIILLLLSVFLLLLSGYLAGTVLVLNGPLCIIAAFTQLPEGIPYFLTCIGIGLMSCGLGLLLFRGMIILSRKFIVWLIRLFGRIASKKPKKM